MATLAGTLARLDDEQKDRLDVVFVTTDPARDTEAVVEDYVSAFDPSIIGLTGDLDDIVGVARSMAVAVDRGEKLPSGGYEVTHGTRVLAIDAADDTTDDVGPGRLPGPAGPRRHRAARRRMISPMPPLPSPMVTLMSIPSPSQGVWHLGPLPLRGYALCIILGIVAAIWIGERRWVARGGTAGEVSDLADLGDPVRPGRRPALPRHHRLAPLLRRGQEPGHRVVRLARRPRHLGRHRARRARRVAGGTLAGHQAAAAARRPRARACSSPRRSAGGATGSTRSSTAVPPTSRGDSRSTSRTVRSQYLDVATYHPAFLYECLWNLAAFAVLIWLDRRFRLGHGRVVALYVMLYTLGRGWIENLRIDDVQMNDVFGLRLNVWTSIVLFVLAAVYFVVSARRHPGREDVVRTREPDTDERAEERSSSDPTA